MRSNGKILGVAVLALMLSAPSTQAAEVGVQQSGSVTLTLNPLASDPGASKERWSIQIQDATASAADSPTVTGTVRIGGVPIERAEQLGKVDWQISGTTVSGTVSNPSGGPALASFKGTVDENGMQGTFTVLSGQSGSWAWEGPLPEIAVGTEAK